MDNNVLTVQDILERILLFADEKSLAFCSVVSKQWSPLANRLLWSSLDSQRPLLALLAPLHLQARRGTRYTTLNFDTTQPLKWERFNLYSLFVRRLTIRPDEYLYAETIVSTLALWRVSSSLLPNLQELIVKSGRGGTYNYPFDFALLFLSENLKALRISFKKDEENVQFQESDIQSLAAFTDALPKRCHALRTICLCVEDGRERCAIYLSNAYFAWLKGRLADLLLSLNSLETIILCPKFMDPELLLALSSLRNVRCMKLCCTQHYLCETPEVSGASRRSFRKLENNGTGLASLEEFILSSYFSVATEFLAAFTLPHWHLTTLAIKSQHIVEQLDCLQSLLLTIGQSFPRLQRLDLVGPKFENPAPGAGEKTYLNLVTFRPLSLLPNLRSFSISIPHQIRLSLHDFEHLVSHWPLLEELRLDSGFQEPYLTPHVLQSLAQYCPSLRILIMDVAWDKLDYSAQMSVDMVSDIRHGFMNLDRLNFSLLPVKESQSASIAIFLVDLSISSSAIQIPGVIGEPWSAYRYTEPYATWMEIKKLMTIAGHYRNQNRCLRDELLAAKGIKGIDYRSLASSPSVV